MKVTFYRSLDDGQFYPEDAVDPIDRNNSTRYQLVSVNDIIVIGAKDLPGNNDIMELLTRAQALLPY